MGKVKFFQFLRPRTLTCERPERAKFSSKKTFIELLIYMFADFAHPRYKSME